MNVNPEIRKHAIALTEVALSMPGSTMFEAHRKVQKIISLITKLQKLIPFTNSAGHNVIIYTCQMADKAMAGHKLGNKTVWEQLHTLLGKLQDDLT